MDEVLRDPPADPVVLAAAVRELRDRVAAEAAELVQRWGGAESLGWFASSAENLAAYVVLRRHDLVPLQGRLTDLGVSSLGRSEAHVLASLDAVRAALCRLSGDPAPLGGVERAAAEAAAAVAGNEAALFGPPHPTRTTKIMVTLPSDAADDGDLVERLVLAGMDTARINCAHDGPEEWARMAAHVRGAGTRVGQPVTVLMDLGGPKLRTGDLAPGPAVVRLRPERDERGRVVGPALVVLDGTGAPGHGHGRAAGGERAPARLSVPGRWVRHLRPGDAVRLRDLRGRKRVLEVLERGPGDVALAATERTAWLEPGVVLDHRPAKGGAKRRAAPVGPVVGTEARIRVRSGDVLRLTSDPRPGTASADPAGHQVVTVPCAQPEVLLDLRPGERVFVDDGKIEGVVLAADVDAATIEVRAAGPDGARLRSGKGLNFPDSRLSLPSLTDKDREDLEHVVRLADVVGCSFVRTGTDMADFVVAIDRAASAAGRAEPLGVVAKVETRQAVESLPDIIVAGGRRHPFGVMIARGDLAVEVGWDHLAEAAERVLWFTEAGRVPVIWATQVLEGMVKTGTPSRAEVVDAARAGLAECVMLNKGPYAVEAVERLHGMLRRLQPYLAKKRDQMPALGPLG